MTVDNDTLDEAVTAALEEVAPDVDVSSLDPHRNLRDQVELDSVDFLNFVTALERRLDLRIPEGDYPKLSSLEGCRRYLAA
ncbi:acyl carrier protein [Ectothiorhodospiraceae bacterium WFHF3C12]|nr:acyl carrier protein [Ectothiorhodospiraceae bacterium WFHF3C12]